MSFSSNFFTNKKMKALNQKNLKINYGIFKVGENDISKCITYCCIPVSEQIYIYFFVTSPYINLILFYLNLKKNHNRRNWKSILG